MTNTSRSSASRWRLRGLGDVGDSAAMLVLTASSAHVLWLALQWYTSIGMGTAHLAASDAARLAVIEI